MAGLMMLFPKLLTNLTIVVIMPFSLCKLACMFCMKTIFIVIQTWMELVKAAVCFHVNMFWKAVIWTVALISLPVRVLTALQRERVVSFDKICLEILSANYCDKVSAYLIILETEKIDIHVYVALDCEIVVFNYLLSVHACFSHLQFFLQHYVNIL